MKIALIVMAVIVGLAIRVGIRMALRAGTRAAFGGGPTSPSCPHCDSLNVRRVGGHWDCGTCGQMF